MRAKNILFLSFILMVVYTTSCANNESTVVTNNNPVIPLGYHRLKPKRQTVITNLHSADKQELPA